MPISLASIAKSIEEIIWSVLAARPCPRLNKKKPIIIDVLQTSLHEMAFILLTKKKNEEKSTLLFVISSPSTGPRMAAEKKIAHKYRTVTAKTKKPFTQIKWPWKKKHKCLSLEILRNNLRQKFNLAQMLK